MSGIAGQVDAGGRSRGLGGVGRYAVASGGGEWMGSGRACALVDAGSVLRGRLHRERCRLGDLRCSSGTNESVAVRSDVCGHAGEGRTRHEHTDQMVCIRQGSAANARADKRALPWGPCWGTGRRPPAERPDVCGGPEAGELRMLRPQRAGNAGCGWSDGRREFEEASQGLGLVPGKLDDGCRVQASELFRVARGAGVGRLGRAEDDEVGEAAQR